MPFENRMSNSAAAVCARREALDETWTLRRRIGAPGSSLKMRAVAGLAFAARWIYPLLHSPLIEQLGQSDADEGPPAYGGR
jgi:hypothetical protein